MVGSENVAEAALVHDLHETGGNQPQTVHLSEGRRDNVGWASQAFWNRIVLSCTVREVLYQRAANGHSREVVEEVEVEELPDHIHKRDESGDAKVEAGCGLLIRPSSLGGTCWMETLSSARWENLFGPS